MSNPVDASTLLNDAAARQLANTTKTPPQWVGATPRWLVQLLPWTPVEAGVYRVNQVIDNKFAVQCSPELGSQLPTAFIDYEPKPREYLLNTVSTTVQVSTRISDLYRSPMEQVKEQLRIAVERLKEKQEDELINNGAYGLVNNVHESMRVKSRDGKPTPDDLDELLSRVWKEPSFFLAHPRAIAAFGRECTWRGVPIIPCDKLHLAGNKADFLLLRTGEQRRGVVGLFQPGLPGEVSPSLSVRLMGIDQRGVAAYLVSLYCSAAALTSDALGALESVEVDGYHEYK